MEKNKRIKIMTNQRQLNNNNNNKYIRQAPTFDYFFFADVCVHVIILIIIENKSYRNYTSYVYIMCYTTHEFFMPYISNAITTYSNRSLGATSGSSAAATRYILNTYTYYILYYYIIIVIHVYWCVLILLTCIIYRFYNVFQKV